MSRIQLLALPGRRFALSVPSSPHLPQGVISAPLLDKAKELLDLLHWRKLALLYFLAIVHFMAQRDSKVHSLLTSVKIWEAEVLSSLAQPNRSLFGVYVLLSLVLFKVEIWIKTRQSVITPLPRVF